MRGGVILIIIALFVIYLGVSGKFCCFTQFLKCALSSSLKPCCECNGAKDTVSNLLPDIPQLPALPKLPNLPPLNSLG